MAHTQVALKRPPETPQTGADRPTASNVAVRWLRLNGIIIAVYVAAFFLWQILVKLFSVPTWILPSPFEIIQTIVDHPHQLAMHTWVTFKEVVIGFLLGTAVSIPLGVLLVYSRILERIIYPALVAFQATPKVALAPILVVWFGFGSGAKVVLALLSAAFPIVINTVIGMEQTPREIRYLMKSLRASSLQLFVKARLPIAAPYIFGGLKIGITLAVVGAVVGEFIASNAGLGYLLLVANNNINTPMLFAVVVILAVMSSVLFYLLELAESLLLPRPLRRRGNKLNPGVSS